MTRKRETIDGDRSMRTSEITSLFDFHYWTIGRLLNAAVAIDPACFATAEDVPFGNLRALLVHTLDTDIRGRQMVQELPGATELRPDSFANAQALWDAWRDEEHLMRGYLSTLD